MQSYPPRRLLRISARAALVWCFGTVTAFIFVRPILSTLIPIWESMIDSMQSDYVGSLRIVGDHGNEKIAMVCTATRTLYLPDGRIVPFLGSIDCAYIDAVHALVPIVIFLVTLLGWPTRTGSEMPKRFLAALPLIPCVAAVSAPVALVGLENIGRNPSVSGAELGTMTGLFQPFVFMELGGRWLLPLVAAGVCIWLADWRSSTAKTRPPVL